MTNPTPMSDSAPKPIEIVYNEVDGVSITMDVYIPEKKSPFLCYYGGMVRKLYLALVNNY